MRPLTLREQYADIEAQNAADPVYDTARYERSLADGGDDRIADDVGRGWRAGRRCFCDECGGA